MTNFFRPRFDSRCSCRVPHRCIRAWKRVTAAVIQRSEKYDRLAGDSLLSTLLLRIPGDLNATEHELLSIARSDQRAQHRCGAGDRSNLNRRRDEVLIYRQL